MPIPEVPVPAQEQQLGDPISENEPSKEPPRRDVIKLTFEELLKDQFLDLSDIPFVSRRVQETAPEYPSSSSRDELANESVGDSIPGKPGGPLQETAQEDPSSPERVVFEDPFPEIPDAPTSDEPSRELVPEDTNPPPSEEPSQGNFLENFSNSDWGGLLTEQFGGPLLQYQSTPVLEEPSQENTTIPTSEEPLQGIDLEADLIAAFEEDLPDTTQEDEILASSWDILAPIRAYLNEDASANSSDENGI